MDRIAIVRTEAQRLADVLVVTSPNACCPTCPDWSAADPMPDRPSATPDLLALRERATAALLEQLSHRAGSRPRTMGVDARWHLRRRLSRETSL